MGRRHQADALLQFLARSQAVDLQDEDTIPALFWKETVFTVLTAIIPILSNKSDSWSRSTIPEQALKY